MQIPYFLPSQYLEKIIVCKIEHVFIVSEHPISISDYRHNGNTKGPISQELGRYE